MKSKIIHEGILTISDRNPIQEWKIKNANAKPKPINILESETVSKAAKKFLIKSADARMMDAAEGRLAAEKGTTPDIRKYGELMIADQAKLLAQLKKLAEDKGIRLPDQISSKKEHFRKKLSEKNGSDFDKKFIRMITIDHKRDVRMFRQATKGKDAEISAFAKEYLPLIQTHLDKINEIKDNSQH